MLADPRSETLATRFAAQWLRLNDVDQILPDAILYPYFDRTLGDSLIRETELFFDSIVREDRSVLDLLTADYTLRERAGGQALRHPQRHRHRVPARSRCPSTGAACSDRAACCCSPRSPTAPRRSCAASGSWKCCSARRRRRRRRTCRRSSRPMRTSAARCCPTRERMEEHRKNPACASCHRVIDPLGLALDNFDVTGRWRIKDNGKPVDATGRDVRRHQARWPGQPARGAAEPPGRLPRDVHREPDDLRARPPRSSTTTCRPSARSRAARQRTTTASLRSSWASSTAARFR